MIASRYKRKAVMCCLVCCSLVLSSCSNSYDPSAVKVERVLPEQTDHVSEDPISLSSNGVQGQLPSEASTGSAPTVPAQTEPCYSGCYRAQAGDTVYSIAVHFQKDYRDIAAWNHISPDSDIAPGRLIYLTPEGLKPQVRHVSDDLSQVSDDDLYKETILKPTHLPLHPLSAKQIESTKKSTEMGAVVSSASVLTGTAVPSSSSVHRPLDSGNTKAADPLVSSSTEEPSHVRTAKTNQDDMDTSRFQWPAVGEVLHLYGQGPEKEGVDIATMPGASIYASASGRVVFAKRAVARYGNLIIIKHDNDWVTAYSHLGDLLVKEGMAVSLGQKIAQALKNRQEDIYIHFEIRHHGHAIDPVSIIMEGNTH